MALKNLSNETMLALSASWTDPERERPALEASVAAPLLPKLDAAHEGLVATAQPAAVSEAERELSELQAKEAEVDRVHDRKLRGTYYLLTGLAELADDPGVADSRLALRDALFPAGLAATQRTYLEEAGDVEALPRRLDDELAPRLDEAFVTPLRLAEAKADRKARGARAADEGDAPAGGEGDAPSGGEAEVATV